MYRKVDSKFDADVVVVTAEDKARNVLWNLGTALRDIAEKGTGTTLRDGDVRTSDLYDLAQQLGAMLYTAVPNGTFGRAFPFGPERDAFWDSLLIEGTKGAREGKAALLRRLGV